jgi:hypothetical protein
MLGKLILVLFSSIWLSCGDSPQKTATRTYEVQEKAEKVVKTHKVVVLKDTSEKEVAILSEEIKEKVEVQKPVSQKSEQLEPQKEAPNKSEIAKKLTTPIHSKWSNLLSKYVNDSGDVDYKSFQENKNQLQDYLDHLAENSPKKEWSKNEKLAYYINLYNAATIKLILDNFPTSSIKDIKNPWRKSWVKTGDGLLSLGDIEHKILRKMNEPRIHFAINCASYSCPKLLNVAFTAAEMEKQLHQVTISFINDTALNKLSEEKLELSSIFKWYKKDFTKSSSLVDYLKLYTKIEIKPNADIDYLKYNWSLNEAK